MAGVVMVPQPAEGSVLDRRTLNRTLLLRQRLLEPARGSIRAMVEWLVGMQAQVPRDPYIGLRARLPDFDPASLERMFLEHEAVRMTLMRTTLHLVTARDAPIVRSTVQVVCDRGFASSPFRRALVGVDVDAVCAAGIELIEERPRGIRELGSALVERFPGRDPMALAYAVRYLVPVVQVPPRGLLRRSSAPAITTLSSWLGSGSRPPDRAAPPDAAGSPDAAGPSDRADPTPADPAGELVIRYLRAFGPATAADVRAWSWLPAPTSILARLRPRLRTYGDAAGRELFDAADGEFAPPDTQAPVRFLGEYDNLFLAHADRTRITGDLAWGTSWARWGTFFVGGFLAGAWRLPDPKRATIEVDPRRELSDDQRSEVAAEARGVARFLVPEAPEVDVRWSA